MRVRGKPGRRINENPFYVLGLPPGCTRAEIEREGQKLIGMLELGLSAACTYVTPLGRFERTTDKVREAMAELRDPDRRLGHELWASAHVVAASDHAGPAAPSSSPHGTAGQATARRRDSKSNGELDAPTLRKEGTPERLDEPTGWPDALVALGWRRR